MDDNKRIRFLRAALYFSFGAFVLLWMMLILQGCATKNEARVVLYCSVDEVYAKPLIKKLELQTGLKIDALFDTEATKTAGLANRIRAERDRPRADVFWSSALLQTLLMSDEGALQAYDSPAARDLPARFRGKDWVGVGARAHILVTRTPQSFDLPTVADLTSNGLSPIGISNPQFGTASDWATALSLRWGIAKTRNYFAALKKNDVRILPGNGDVARQTAQGDLRFGVTDSDDYLALKPQNKTFSLLKTNKDNVLVPGAASILKGAPHPENAKKLLDAIASAQGERALTLQMPGVFSLRHLDDRSNFQSGGEDFSFFIGAPKDDYSKWAATWRQIREPLNQIFSSH
ncbi:iron(III) transport system substrate-binding protein [Abditibacterium utsteinense]|uniref:Iron(III) transport system substrate-binding protein n=1 Tax=Abditibacterium utsteinense TaxID=1960156 RepID=A0A2S8SNU1_9BACT|nr:extracellular solute-binding protein [Abditibacterium utsteinense]PQV62464.1 iron(III) transport system substrate-binding protein [Abditibacterium utsteinense]